MSLFPKRIICMTEETTEILYAIGAGDLIIGISAYTVRPPQAKKEKTVISHFTDANIEKIIKLQPNLVIGWSDLQADIARELISRGIEVVNFNHRSVEGIYGMILKLGGLIGKHNEAEKYVDELMSKVDSARKLGYERKHKPKVYFEEWYDPLITGIEWVSEIIEIAGGIETFPEYAKESLAKNRILKTTDEVIPKNPDIMLASWCGKPFKEKKVRSRSGWENLPFIIDNEIHEIPSETILQPGPAALTDGLDQIMSIFDAWEKR